MSQFRATQSDEEFTNIWRECRTSEEAGRRAGMTRRGADKRARGLGLPPKGRRSHLFRQLNAEVVEPVARTLSALDRAAGVPRNPEADPLADPEIRALMDDLRVMAADTRTATDLAPLQRLLLQILTTVVAKAPYRSWDGLASVMADLHKLILHARRVEASLPVRPDPIHLRQEAAKQMMVEIGSVLSKEEQREMGRLLRLAADRRMALEDRGGLTGPDSPEKGGSTAGSCSGPASHSGEVVGGNEANRISSALAPNPWHPW